MVFFENHQIINYIQIKLINLSIDDIKDKLKAYYSLIYIRDKINELQTNGKSIETNENSDSSNKDENK